MKKLREDRSISVPPGEKVEGIRPLPSSTPGLLSLTSNGKKIKELNLVSEDWL